MQRICSLYLLDRLSTRKLLSPIHVYYLTEYFLVIFSLDDVSIDETWVLKSPTVIVSIPLWHFWVVSVYFIKLRATVFGLSLYIFMYVCVLELGEWFVCIHVCAYMYLCMCKEAKGGHRAGLHKALLYFFDGGSIIEPGGRLAASKSHWSS